MKFLTFLTESSWPRGEHHCLLLLWNAYFIWALNYFGWKVGLAVYFSTWLAIYSALKLGFQMERLKSADLIFFRDDSRQGRNLLLFQKIEKIKVDQLRNRIIRRALDFKRLRAKVMIFLGRPFFK
jgi:hypothetical protein